MKHRPSLRHGLLAAAALISLSPAAAMIAPAESRIAAAPTGDVLHRSITIDGIDIFYREAGDPARPTIVLFHGFPTSSAMFRNLIPVLAARYHVLAPDYPGFGESAQPDRETFRYTFANYAAIIEKFLDAKKVDRFSAYVMDYGAPVAFRVFARNPERINAFVVQNGNAYDEGLKEFWDPIKRYWRTGAVEDREALRQFLTIDATKWQYTHGQPRPELVSPDAWNADQFLLDRPGNKEIQLDLFYDYRTNLAEYPKWQKLFRKHQPPALIVWGKNDHIFPDAGAYPYQRDLKNVELHLLDAGHFALESHGALIGAEILEFLSREVDAKR